MVKWFDSNYHYVRPTFSHSTEFKLNTAAGIKPVDEFNEAKALGVQTRPVILGPVSYLYLGKADKDSLIWNQFPCYQRSCQFTRNCCKIEGSWC